MRSGTGTVTAVAVAAVLLLSATATVTTTVTTASYIEFTAMEGHGHGQEYEYEYLASSYEYDEQSAEDALRSSQTNKQLEYEPTTRQPTPQPTPVITTTTAPTPAQTTNTDDASFPTWKKPSAPFVDQCQGKSQKDCVSPRNKGCVWTTKQAPGCVLGKYVNVRPPKVWTTIPKPLVSNFFEFFAGVHLSEGGTHQRFYYNSNVDDCARLCLASAGGLLSTQTYAAPIFGTPQAQYANVRCLSFDFFPFESPATQAPYREAPDRGICVLNSGSRANARLRNVDQALTDAELFHSSFFARRPFSALEGYYEARDVRGDGIAAMLDYTQGTSMGDFVRKWGGSRWGSAVVSLPAPLDSVVRCRNGVAVGVSRDSPSPDNTIVRVGFTPVTVDVDSTNNAGGKCPGLLTKPAAEALCESVGATLCRDATELATLQDIKLGCSFDGYATWTAADVPRSPTETRYPRCCGQYALPIDCSTYSPNNIKYCQNFKTDSACLWGGSGTKRQEAMGFGRAMTPLRQHCDAAIRAGAKSCANLHIQSWTPRDTCIWCPTNSGVSANGGTGVCIPGHDFGACALADDAAQSMFRLAVRGQCTQDVVCGLVNAIPRLSSVLGTTR